MTHFHLYCICLVLLGEGFGPVGAISRTHDDTLLSFFFHLHHLRMPRPAGGLLFRQDVNPQNSILSLAFLESFSANLSRQASWERLPMLHANHLHLEHLSGNIWLYF
jgi:hypothetical protein